MTDSSPELDLLDWRRRVAELYGRIRATVDPSAAWEMWRQERDDLLRNHAQSPLPPEGRRFFGGVALFDYDPAYRVIATVEPSQPTHYDVLGSDGSQYGFTEFAAARFSLAGRDVTLPVLWLEGYAGGVFVAFRDLTSGDETYGGGRYLLDTIKGADLGTAGDDRLLVFDFNFAYQPSCSYDSRWSCPLPPPGATLPVAVRAGERVGTI